MPEKEDNLMPCRDCGDTFQLAKDRLQDFQQEASEELYCPECKHQKHFGVIHSE